MTTNYPSSLDTETELPVAAIVDGVTTGHDDDHPTVHGAARALEAKVGTGSSNASDATTGDVLTKQADGTTLWAAVGSTGTPITPGPYALIYISGSNYIGRKTSDGSTISSGTDFKTVLQAVIDDIASAGGGRIGLAHGAYTLDTAGVTISNPGLIQLVGNGGHSFNRQNGNLGVGTKITATGTWTSDTSMLTIGASGAGNYAAACLIKDIAFDGAGKDINILHGFNAQDLKVEGCTFDDISKTNARKFIWLESDQSTNAGSGANYKILNCWMRSAYHSLYTSGTGGSDGQVVNCDMWSCVRTVEIHNGGFQISGCHLVGNATDTDYHIFCDGVHPVIVDNYLDSAKTTGWLLEFGTGMTNGLVSGNHFLTGTTGGICIRLTAPRATITGNTFLTQGGPFVKYNVSPTTFGSIVGNGGQGPTSGAIIQDSTAADITADAGGTGSGYVRLANVIL